MSARACLLAWRMENTGILLSNSLLTSRSRCHFIRFNSFWNAFRLPTEQEERYCLHMKNGTAFARAHQIWCVCVWTSKRSNEKRTSRRGWMLSYQHTRRKRHQTGWWKNAASLWHGIVVAESEQTKLVPMKWSYCNVNTLNYSTVTLLFMIIVI